MKQLIPLILFGLALIAFVTTLTANSNNLQVITNITGYILLVLGWVIFYLQSKEIK